MMQTPSMKLVFNQFVRQSSRLLLISLGVTTFSGLWVIQQNNVNRLDAKIISLKNSIDLAEEESKKRNARDQSFTVEKKLSLEKDILLIEKDKATIQNGVYTTLVQALGGLILSITAYVGYCNFRIGEKNLKVTEDKQVTERFSKSIEHLGSEKIDIRLGGIYALEQIAIDSSKYHWTIMEILSAFVREKSKEVFLNKLKRIEEKKSSRKSEKVGEDIKAVLTVINRRNLKQDPQGKKIDLRKVNMACVGFQEAIISGVDLSLSDFSDANFSSTDFSKSDLANSNFRSSNFKNANFSDADLRNVNFAYADVSGANFSNADLSGSYLCDSNFINTNLTGTNLSNAILRYDYQDENYDDHPSDFDYDKEPDFPEWPLAPKLSGAIMTDAKLNSTKLDGADLSKSVGLTQQQLDSAIINEYTELPDYLKPKVNFPQS